MAIVLAALGLGTVFVGVPRVRGFVADAALDRLADRVLASEEGDTIDLAEALEIEWDHAYFVQPYSTGSDMNAIIGFDGFRPGDSAVPNDQAQQVVFTDAETVAANLVLHARESYRFDEEDHFAAHDARFVVEWRDDGPHLVRP